MTIEFDDLVMEIKLGRPFITNEEAMLLLSKISDDKTTPVTGEIEARLRKILAAAWETHWPGNTAGFIRDGKHDWDSSMQLPIIIALEAMAKISLDRASGDGVRDAIVTATSDNTLYYLRSIYRQFKEFKDHFNSEAMQRVEDVNPGPSIGSEVLADNADWLNCHIDFLERTARAALSAVSIPQENWKRPEPVEFAIVEGGIWHPWVANMTFTAHDRNFHAIKFSNGSVFDMVNGWRK